MSTTADTKTYVGNCHCGAFKFTLTRPALTSATTCNCSMCARKGYLYIDIPEAEKDPDFDPTKHEGSEHKHESKNAAFKVERGEDKLKRYTFGSGKWVHDFCPKCGTTCLVKELGSDPERFYINARCLQDVDLKDLKIDTCAPEMDGKAWPGDWKPASPIEPPKVEGGEDLETYQGQCHCGKVKYAFKSKPLEKIQANSCDCSMCTRTATLTAHIPHDHISWSGLDSATIYTGVGNGTAKHRFCSTCGVPVGIDTKGMVIPEEIKKYIPEEVQENLKHCPVNLRCIEDLDEKKLNIREWENSGGYKVE